jgi:Polysaccharide pyruvyl transferase
MIGQLCTCDVDNFGDVLYPVIFKKMAERHGVASASIPLGILAGAAPCGGGYAIRSIGRALQPDAQKISCLVIGGGDLLRTDVPTLANHYSSFFDNAQRPGFWSGLKRMWHGGKYRDNQFAAQFMGYSPIAPFILDRAKHPQVGATVFCSCGVPFRFGPEKSDAIRAAFASAAFIYLRDAQSVAKLREIGVTREIAVAPDLIVALSDFSDLDEERRKGLKLLAGYGVDTTKEIICFQSSPQNKKQTVELLQQLSALKAKTGRQIVLLPIGYCHGDDVFLKRLAQKSGGAFTYAGIHSVHGIISVITASRFFIGTSMHGNITAFSFGIPHLFGPLAVDKAEGFLEVCGLNADFKLKSWSDLGNEYERVACLPPDFFTLKAQVAKQKVHLTFEKIAPILNAFAR